MAICSTRPSPAEVYLPPPRGALSSGPRARILIEYDFCRIARERQCLIRAFATQTLATLPSPSFSINPVLLIAQCANDMIYRPARERSGLYFNNYQPAKDVWRTNGSCLSLSSPPGKVTRTLALTRVTQGIARVRAYAYELAARL